MTTGQQLQRINGSGWRIGFGNLLRKENSEWWGTRAWLVQLVIWFAIINGIVATILWMAPQAMADDPDALFTSPAEAVPEALGVFFGVAGIATAIGVVIAMQGAIMDEKESGTLEWVLSKPVARPAVILSKFLANGIAALVLMVLVQGAITYGQFMLAGGQVNALRFLAGLGLLSLHVLFYLSLTLLLGVVLKGRGGVIGLPMLLVFGYQIGAGMAPGLAPFMPWGLVMPISPEIEGLAQMVSVGQPLPNLTPIFATVVWIVVMLALAIWRFEKMEF